MDNVSLEESPVSNAIASFLANHDEIFFVQVGGYDGVSFDPIRPSIVAGRMGGLIIEPLPDNFAKLTALYEGSDKVRPVCCAIAEEDGERTIWRFSERAFTEHRLNDLFRGVSSFVMEDLLHEAGSLGSLYTPEIRQFLFNLLEAVQVPCRTFESLLREQGVERVDLLQIDTEGYDYKLLRTFDLARYHPAIVHYETQHLSAEEKTAAEEMLTNHGYRIHRMQYDTLAFRPELVSL